MWLNIIIGLLLCMNYNQHILFQRTCGRNESIYQYVWSFDNSDDIDYIECTYVLHFGSLGLHLFDGI